MKYTLPNPPQNNEIVALSVWKGNGCQRSKQVALPHTFHYQAGLKGVTSSKMHSFVLNETKRVIENKYT